MFDLIYGALVSWNLTVLLALWYAQRAGGVAARAPRQLAPLPVTLQGRGQESLRRK